MEYRKQPLFMSDGIVWFKWIFVCFNDKSKIIHIADRFDWYAYCGIVLQEVSHNLQITTYDLERLKPSDVCGNCRKCLNDKELQRLTSQIQERGGHVRIDMP